MISNQSIFDLPNASELMCVFNGERNSIALIKLYNPKEVHLYSITFTDPAYIKCPLKWKGVHFREGTKSEKDEFLNLIPIETKDRWKAKGLNVLQHYYEYRTLFMGEGDLASENPVQIMFVAGQAKLHSE